MSASVSPHRLPVVSHPGAREGDITVSDHGAGSLRVGSPDTRFNGRAAVRLGDPVACSCSPQTVLSGHPTVRVNGTRVARAGIDACGCGAQIASGSPDVRLGHPAVDENGDPFVVPPECQWLVDHQGIDGNPGTLLDRLRTPHQVDSVTPTRVEAPGASKAAGTMFEATATVVIVRGHRIRIIEPAGPLPAPPAYRPTTEQIAKALSTLPERELSNIEDVTIAPGAPADDRIADTSGSHVVYYEQPHAKTQADLDWALIHEGAHAYQDAHPEWENEWQRAMREDARGVSGYGTSGGAVEDFADSMVLYRLTKGTACEATARAHYPKRYALMDRDFAAEAGAKAGRGGPWR